MSGARRRAGEPSPLGADLQAFAQKWGSSGFLSPIAKTNINLLNGFKKYSGMLQAGTLTQAGKRVSLNP